MRIAIISDLHANLEAVEAFRETYDELWVLGDLVTYGPNPREVIDFVRRYASIVVRGNHDNAIGCGEDPRCSAPYREMARTTGEFTASVLSTADKDYLARLPLTASREIDGTRFFLCHATPPNPLFEYAPPDFPGWPDYAERSGADVLLAGHTHQPFIRHERGRVIANPGSLGQPKTGNPDSCYAVWDGTKIELRSFRYDYAKTIGKLQRLNFPLKVQADLATVLRTGGNPGQNLRSETGDKINLD
jgi:putative phosphoesterase